MSVKIKAKNFRAKIAKIFKSATAKRITLSVPGVSGMALLSFGVALIYLPAGIIVGGVLLLMVDHNL